MLMLPIRGTTTRAIGTSSEEWSQSATTLQFADVLVIFSAIES